MLHANFTALSSVEAEYCRSKFGIAGIRNFALFCTYATLTLTGWPSYFVLSSALNLVYAAWLDPEFIGNAPRRVQLSLTSWYHLRARYLCWAKHYFGVSVYVCARLPCNNFMYLFICIRPRGSITHRQPKHTRHTLNT